MNLLLLCLLPLVYSYNFLIYSPIFGHSHTNFMGKIADTLTEAGHNVTVLMPVGDRRMENKTGLKTTKDVIKLKMSADMDLVMDAMMVTMKTQTWLQKVDPIAMLKLTSDMTKSFEYMCRDTLSHDDVIEELRNRHFDVAISEPMMVCGFGLFEQLGIPATIAAASTLSLDIVANMIGQPLAPSYVPGTMSTSGEKMTWWQRWKNLFHSKITTYMFSGVYEAEHRQLVKKFGANVKSTEELIAGVSFQFINTNPLIDFPFPTIQKNVAIAGIQVNTKNKDKVNKEWDKILSQRSRNVLISFGSIAKSVEMPDEYKTALLEVFASMPDTTFIWKYEEEGAAFASHLKNVRLSTWVPQNALLGDPRLSLFITHGGLGSTTELAHLGKPAIMIPLFGDQGRNAAMLSRHGGAKVLEKFDLANPTTVKEAIEEVLGNKNYSTSAFRLSEMLRQQPVSATQLVVKHCEFVAKFGALPLMDQYGRHQNMIEYYFLDVAVLFIVLKWAATYVGFRVMRFFYGLLPLLARNYIESTINSVIQRFRKTKID